MKEEKSRNEEVKRKSDRTMRIVQTLGKEVMRIICEYGLQSGTTNIEKNRFMMK